MELINASYTLPIKRTLIEAPDGFSRNLNIANSHFTLYTHRYGLKKLLLSKINYQEYTLLLLTFALDSRSFIFIMLYNTDFLLPKREVFMGKSKTKTLPF